MRHPLSAYTATAYREVRAAGVSDRDAARVELACQAGADLGGAGAGDDGAAGTQPPESVPMDKRGVAVVCVHDDVDAAERPPSSRRRGARTSSSSVVSARTASAVPREARIASTTASAAGWSRR
jgi:hypothetical protein